jgi:hypothetical protein
MPKTVTWDVTVVVDEILKSLKSKTTPPDLLIGTDAKYSLPILRLLPEWFKDSMISIHLPIPIPAVMKKS